jgi:hypothetical protein
VQTNLTVRRALKAQHPHSRLIPDLELIDVDGALLDGIGYRSVLPVGLAKADLEKRPALVVVAVGYLVKE